MMNDDGVVDGSVVPWFRGFEFRGLLPFSNATEWPAGVDRRMMNDVMRHAVMRHAKIHLGID